MTITTKSSTIMEQGDAQNTDKNQRNAQFDWIIEVMLKMNKAFKKYI